MTTNLGAASILALALFILPVTAQDTQPVPEQPAVEQPAAPAAEAPAAAPVEAAPVAAEVPAEVLALLSDTRPLSEFSVDELKARSKQARRFAKNDKLSDDIRGQLAAIADGARGELEARQQAAKSEEKPKQLEVQAEPAQKAAEPAPKVEQPAAPAAEAPAAAPVAAKVPAEVLALLSDSRPLSEFSVDELKARSKQARRFAKNDKLSDDIRGQLATISDGALGELEARQQAAQPAEPPKQPEVQAEPAQKAAEPAPKVEEPAQPVAEAPKAPEKKVAAQAEPAPMPDEVMALLGDTRAPADLSVDELKGRAKAARGFSKDNSLPKDIRAQLAGLAKDARTELAAREQQQAAPQAEPKVDAPAIVQEAPKVEAPKAEAPVVTEAPKTDAPVVTEAPKTDAPVVVQEAPKLDAPAVVQEVPKGDAPAVAQETPKVDAPVVQDAPKVDLPPVAAVAAPAAADVKVLDSNAGDPASEKQAKAYLADGNPIDQLSDEDLRTRLDNIRDLMAGNELSRDTERAVRDKLKGERAVLRQRLAVKEAAANAKVAASKPEEPAPKPDQSVVSASMPPLPAAPATAPPPPPLPPAAAGSTTTNNTTITNTTIITNITPAIVVLRDTRPAEELRVTELQRRVQVYNDAQFDDSYDEENRNYWRGSLERDREILRRRLIDERRRRAEQLALNSDNSGINIDINIDLSPGRPRPRRDVFAAEVDEQELEDVLVAPPRQMSKRRYSLEEVALEPKIRQSVNRIEIDTIRFGTNQSFIREEQVNSLDGIAAIIERIVKKYPNEVFLVEGHTDAVGGAAQNDRLSKLRAEAVKKALVTYYVIPPENLRTVGLGERFLKIPTAEAEPENRRVSISRITQLLGDKQ